MCGTTALVAVIVDCKDRKGMKKCIIANAGDSRAMLVRENKNKESMSMTITQDHKPNNEKEEKRIQSVGGFVTKQTTRTGRVIARVNGILSVSRALGDHHLDGFVSCIPDVFTIELSFYAEETLYLVMACDGVWDVLGEDQVSKIISDSKGDVDVSAEMIKSEALRLDSRDNISIVVVKIDNL